MPSGFAEGDHEIVNELFVAPPTETPVGVSGTRATAKVLPDTLALLAEQPLELHART